MLNTRRKLSVEPKPSNGEPNLIVAFATQDRRHVDQHFGSARCVMIYNVDATQWSLLEAVEYCSVDEDRHAKLPTRISDLSELNCSAIFCNACGVSAIRQLLENGINPIKVHLDTDIHSLISGLQQQLLGEPMGWVKRALKAHSGLQGQKRNQGERPTPDSDRLSQLMDEEW
ncbi:NifB/NifX family molybdenum-iron cluster-binding protein [Vibrio ulleungensis]|uniref:Nitrogen fixation protein NifX n=1 Tax=Vibrio ulleungensis TaxID=2807619 RepID=A0ABS2HGJ8_9VIBR|nr:NifB/NifX family molybdenum-iron cluster-binding protein [Vibrio ulleungensis]MBM7035587.1 nitrogen fixation protein NifX [Vibrio ulleungensis]